MKLHELLDVVTGDYIVLNQISTLMPDGLKDKERYYNMDVEEVRITKAYCTIVIVVHDPELDEEDEQNG
ncbi:MAG: hypothetical protein J6U19_05330 [Oscillospiraceae bacterium]|nr:hypothetical protein [Oscillospiraceae bacterium]